jgi:hypothetical protein
MLKLILHNDGAKNVSSWLAARSQAVCCIGKNRWKLALKQLSHPLSNHLQRPGPHEGSSCSHGAAPGYYGQPPPPHGSDLGTPHYPPLQPTPTGSRSSRVLSSPGACTALPPCVPGSTSSSLPSSVWCYHTLVSYISTRGLLTSWWPVSPIQTLADDVGRPWIIPFVRHLRGLQLVSETSKLSVCTSFTMYSWIILCYR